MGGILVCRKSSIGHEAPSAVWYRYQAGRGFPARPHGQGKEALHFRWACLCAGEISAAGLYAKGAGYCLCRGRPAGHAGDSGNGCKKQVLVQCGCNAHVASGFFCVKIIFDNVDFQLFLTQILYLNSKRVKIGGEQELSTSQAAKDLELTPTSISRASKQLEEMGLLHIKKEGVPQFYRFSHPITNQYPVMIELFTRKLDAIQLPEDAVLTPLPMDEDISSLSAILLDDDYYEFLKQGKVTVDGVTVLDAAYLIPFKAKAWMDLADRKAAGEHVDSKNIKKHKNDVFRLTELIDSTAKVVAPQGVYADIQEFVQRMKNENVDIKQLGLVGKTKEKILEELKAMYETL